MSWIDGDTGAERGCGLRVAPGTRGATGGPPRIAAQAGLRGGDVVVALDGKPAAGAPLLRRLAEAPAGSVLRLDVRRGGESVSAEVTVGAWTVR